MDHTTSVRGFLSQLLKKTGDIQPFSDSDSLLLSGRLQSLDALELIVFLETTYGLDFADRPFDQANIDSVDEIVSLLADEKQLA